jgi:hypothetical protein
MAGIRIVFMEVPPLWDYFENEAKEADALKALLRWERALCDVGHKLILKLNLNLGLFREIYELAKKKVLSALKGTKRSL